MTGNVLGNLSVSLATHEDTTKMGDHLGMGWVSEFLGATVRTRSRS